MHCHNIGGKAAALFQRLIPASLRRNCHHTGQARIQFLLLFKHKKVLISSHGGFLANAMHRHRETI